ncbi:hypothetical protein EWF20_08610 [Sulfolobus sp. S-194]|uniref:hypothetical protein n=1 Tax=Sulfolobus sp. S-194 TaxID=2512240 RepID=UPI0014372FAF|nr:hypothetical protein [Sulfolobus sp. S-194]QIW24198.1 hypothetical protein EWF20_08610 [Sulfolobus sp. S-194]
MKVEELIDIIKWEGFKEALFYGLSECEELGKEFIGITLDNGDGIILRVNPYEYEILYILLYSNKKYSNNDLRLIGIFKSEENGNTYFIYQITNLRNFINMFGNDIKVIYVEVIRDALEDFLYTAMA